MRDHYILVNRQVVAVNSEEWLQWLDKQEGNVGVRVALHTRNDVRVSTIFLSTDHQWEDGGPPLLFETMVFIDDPKDPDHPGHDYEMRRYSTWDEAVLGHIEICNMVFKPGWKEMVLADYDESTLDEDGGDRPS